MLDEYALVPDLFDTSSYSPPELCQAHLQYLKEPLLHEALIRDLRNGGWSEYARAEIHRWNPRAKELLKKLIGQNRLRRSVPVLNRSPSNYSEWCEEAVASHGREQLTGVIATNHVAEAYRHNGIVTSIEKLSSAAWWQGRSNSLRMDRKTSQYRENLRLVLGHANSLMFIDRNPRP